MPAFDQSFSNTVNRNNNSIKTNSASIVSILHFNDCYNVESRSDEPSGGAARLVTAFNSFKDCQPLVLFSGDIMSPSIMSTFTRGEQMIPVLNALDVDCAVFGNHEFDFGTDHLNSWMKRTPFPWLMSNVYDSRSNRPFCNGKVWHIIDRHNKRFGIIGLVEEQWLADSLHDGYIYRDFASEGRKLAKHLREKESVDFVIALTHMRWPNDCHLAESVAEIDLILGGHDHDYQIRKINNKFCIKSGTDFRQFSKIDIKFNSNSNIEDNIDGVVEDQYEIEIQEINVNSYDFKEDDELKLELRKYSNIFESQMDSVLCQMCCDLDGRFGEIRCKETNLANLICDIACVSTATDAALLNGGMYRSDQIHTAGDFRFKDLVRILPMMDALVILNITGHQLWQALECGIARWPSLDGAFPHVSRIRFKFDPHKPFGNRIDPNCITINDKHLDLNRKYRILSEEYLRKGGDGYHVLKEVEVLVPKEHCLDIFTLVKKYLESVAELTTDPHSNCNKSLVGISAPKTTATQRSDYNDFELQLRQFNPQVEGRITCLDTNVI